MEKTYSKYARIFDENNVNWSKDQKANLMFLKCQQTYATDLLRKKGTVFLNEVYEMLGLPRSQEGCVVGWHYDEKKPIGDNYIDFDLFNVSVLNMIAIDFNVDGRVDQYL